LSETETKVNEISHRVWDDICFATFRGAVTMPAKSPATARTGPAEPLLQEVLRIRQKARRPEHPDTATSLNNLAMLYRANKIVDLEGVRKGSVNNS
jgi:hypothetical protein